MLRLAGQIADGVILSGPIGYLRYAIDIINNEAEKSGRDSNSIEKVVWVPTIPTFKGLDVATAKRVIALVVADTPDQIINLTDVDMQQVELIRKSVRNGGPSQGAAHVTEEIMDIFSVTGNSVHMADQFEAMVKTGATEIVIGPPFSGDWRAAVTEILHEIALRKRLAT